MNTYVEIVLRRNRGWPWPEDSWGLTPMFGEDGWCHDCGLPLRDQIGSLVLKRKGLKVEGAWVPNWQFNAYCLALDLADQARREFGVELRTIATPDGGELDARQVVIECSETPWFDPAELAQRIAAVHGRGHDTCEACGRVRWLPVGMDVLPRPVDAVLAGSPSVLASPEWFGAGKQSFRQILWRRDVADFLVESSPKDFKIQELGT